jgi:TonB family protein
MDNQTHNSEDAWVEGKLSGLIPPTDWYPDPKRAYARVLNRRESPGAGASPRWIRLSMAAAILASIGLVVALLPWHALWRPAASRKSRPSSEIVMATIPAPPGQPQPAAVPLPLQQEQRSAEKPAGPVTEPTYTDEARRAHIQGTVAALQQPAPPAAEPEPKPVEHVGNGVSAPYTIPPMPEPDYTDEARQAHIQGTVILDVTIRADGTGKVNKVVQALGSGLDEKAIEAFEKWRFEPGKKDGVPVDVELHVTINFHLY